MRFFIIGNLIETCSNNKSDKYFLLVFQISIKIGPGKGDKNGLSSIVREFLMKIFFGQ